LGVASPAWDARSAGAVRFAAAVPAATIDRALVERSPESLHAYVRVCWAQIEPGVQFVDGRVIHAMCEILEAISRGEIKRAIINIPPGCMKSLLTGVFWPCWDWLQRAEQRYIYGSYDPSLSLRDARRAYNLLDSPWHMDRWGQILAGPRQPIGDYYTAKGGERFSTSVKGKATGRHFHRHVADDPIKPRDADGGAMFSEAILEECDKWWNQTMTLRAIDLENLARVIVMQRLHESDLAGRCIDRGGYTLINFAMRFEKIHACPWDWRQNEGELLWPERFSEAAVQIAERDLVTQAAIASQLQQRPTPKGGLCFKEHLFSYWHPDGDKKIDPNGRPCLRLPLDRAGSWFTSWDMAFKGAEGSDNVASGAWQGDGTRLFLHYADWKQRTFSQSCAAVLALRERFPLAARTLIEDKANGPAVEDTLKDVLPGITMIDPCGGKVTRANACDIYFERFLIVFPHTDLPGYEWVREMIRILCAFPFVKHDDVVDMLTQAVIWYHGKRNSKLEQAMAKLHTVI
jgi:predicted phage terminase large subunit-like protein